MALKKLRIPFAALIAYFAIAFLYLFFTKPVDAQDWRSAPDQKAGLAPDPSVTTDAVVQVYAARTVRWRRYFGVHTWIAVKPSNATEFTVHEVTRFQLRRNGTTLIARNRPADGYWYGSRPELLSDIRGPGVDEIIQRIEAAIARYPYATKYRAWPGPNSNTFTAFVAREVPELRLDLPPTAIGKDYLGVSPVRKTPSGTGAQLSLMGAAGILVGFEEGVEVNLLGLTFGVDPKSLSIKLPLIGSVGPGRNPKPLLVPLSSELVEVAAEEAENKSSSTN
jgi:hypothetical protein